VRLSLVEEAEKYELKNDAVGLNADKKHAAELAAQLYTYLADVQKLRAQASRSPSELISDGQGFWFADLPAHESLVDSRTSETGPILTIKRPPKLLAPEVPEDLEPWMEAPFDRPGWEPKVRTEILLRTAETDGDQDVAFDELELSLLSNSPEVTESAERWLKRWRAWAREDLRYAPVRKIYRLVEELMVRASARPDEDEVVMAVGCVSFTDANGNHYCRHAVTVPAKIAQLDSGELVVTTCGRVTFDVDAVDSATLPSIERLNEVAETIGGYSDRPSDPEGLGSVLRKFAYQLPNSALYLNTDDAPEQGDRTSISWAPAIVVRPRDPRHQVVTLEKIASQLESGAAAPAPLLPSHLPTQELDPAQENDGSLLEFDGETFSTLPASSRQVQTIRHSGSTSPSVVLTEPDDSGEAIQTAALVIEHLLALGKRVLVTGESRQRLDAILDALPAALRPMVVTADSRGEARIEVVSAYYAIAKFGGLYSPAEAESDEADLLVDISLLFEQRDEQKKAMISLREFETREHEIHDVVGTMPRIAEWHRQETQNHSWLELSAAADNEPCPLGNEDFSRWLRLLRNELSASDAAEIANLYPTVGLQGVASLEEFTELLTITETPPDPRSTSNLNDLIVDIGSDRRRELLHELRSDLDTISNNNLVAHIDETILDPTDGSYHAWSARQAQIAVAVGQIYGTYSRWRHLPVELSMDLGKAVDSATEIRDYLQRGRPFRLTKDSVPKLGIGSPKVLRDNSEFFASVRVAGKSAVDNESLTAFIEGASAWRLLDEVRRIWPAGTQVPERATVSERLAWHDAELSKLNEVLAAAARLRRTFMTLYNQGFPTGDSWSNVAEIERFVDQLDHVHGVYHQVEAQVELTLLADRVERLKAETHSRTWASPLLTAIESRDVTAYEAALERRLGTVRWDSQMNWLGDIRSRLRPLAPTVVAAIEASPTDPIWEARAADFVDAWRWNAVRGWLCENEPPKPEVIGRRLDFIEDQLRNTVSQLANMRAWRRALERQIRNSVGEPTVKDVPAWFGPMHAIADQVGLEQNSFDVVVVEGASQTGLESLFLQFLAPKLVLFGNGMQQRSSPADPTSEDLRGLGAVVLPESYSAQWTRPEISLFDDYACRFGHVIELSEDRTPRPRSIRSRLADGEEPELLTQPMGDNEVVEPFDNLFEQRVFNSLAEDGYTVEPHYDPDDFRINLLVHGDSQSLAVEIADDRWDGAQAYAAQVESKRNLETAGWIFHRIGESDYLSDPNLQIALLRRRLVALNIQPGQQALAEAPAEVEEIELEEDVLDLTLEAEEPELGSLVAVAELSSLVQERERAMTSGEAVLTEAVLGDAVEADLAQLLEHAEPAGHIEVAGQVEPTLIGEPSDGEEPESDDATGNGSGST
jgi:hypothetical protein